VVTRVDDDQEHALVEKPGVWDLPEADYHADPVRRLGGSLSSTTARKLLPPSCPALARWAVDHPVHKDAFDLGSVTHALTLGAGCPIVEVPASSWQTNAAKAAREEARERGAVALLSKDLAAAMAMRDAVHADPVAHALLTLPGRPEQTLIWQEDGTWCRAMCDRWPDPDAGAPVIVDVKTTPDVSDEHLQRSIWNFGYHQQEDWYRRGYVAVHGLQADFAFVFVKTEPPHLVRVVQLDEQLLNIGRARNDEALAVWRECTASGDWPAYPPVDDITLIGPPRWARTREDTW
jgi:PDDEXK-like domain of unknown function (DUF3799)